MQKSIVKWFKDLPESQKVELKSQYPWMSDSHLLDFCPVCSTYYKEANFISETGYMQRTVTYQCKCGCKFTTIG